RPGPPRPASARPAARPASAASSTGPAPAGPASRAPGADQPRTDPTTGPTSTASPASAAATAAAGLGASAAGTGNSTKPSLWQRVTDALGIERKADEGTDTDGAAPAAAGRVTAPAARTAQPASPSTGAPAPRPGTGAPGVTTTTPVGTGTAPTHPGPQQYRVGERPQPAGAPTARTGAVAGAATTGAVAPAASTALLPTTTPPGGPKPAETLAAGPAPVSTPARRTRKARLRLSRLDPWSVMKTSFLFSIAAGIMLVVAVYAVWVVLSTSGLFASVNDIVASVVSTPGDTTPFRVEDYVNTQRVMGVAALIACVDVVIFTALATLGSFLYNLAATMLGGLEITLAED
ncbi:DUF3566 domain-containing protein, partial [Microlunatus capsulatus]|uniref:DUF3566 domain-containing protein n=1 Tax=Microlunatus capsulatus TaxID=99117 RepID=UPI0031D5797C